MAAPTYKTRAIVLRKRKLREKDLIVTLLCEDGTLKSAVAKGARKPGGSHAARIELFRTADLMLAPGSLDIICESRLAPEETRDEPTLEQAAVASPLAELLSYVAQEDLPQPRLFELARASFSQIDQSDVNQLLELCAAAIWKVLAQAGYRPSFTECIYCGESCADGADSLRFSPREGGCICAGCAAPSDALHISANLAGWCAYLINTRFDTIRTRALDTETALAVLSLAREWTLEHIGKRIISLDFLFTCGLFEDESYDNKENHDLV